MRLCCLQIDTNALDLQIANGSLRGVLPRLKARPRPMPVRSALRCSNGRKSSLTSPHGRPPHSSSTSMSTRPALAPTLSATEHAPGAGTHPQRDGRPRSGELEGVLQKIAHDRGEEWRSARIATPSTTGVTVSLTPRPFASNVEADAMPSMNAAMGNGMRAFPHWNGCTQRVMCGRGQRKSPE